MCTLVKECSTAAAIGSLVESCSIAAAGHAPVIDSCVTADMSRLAELNSITAVFVRLGVQLLITAAVCSLVVHTPSTTDLRSPSEHLHPITAALCVHLVGRSITTVGCGPIMDTLITADMGCLGELDSITAVFVRLGVERLITAAICVLVVYTPSAANLCSPSKHLSATTAALVRRRVHCIITAAICVLVVDASCTTELCSQGEDHSPTTPTHTGRVRLASTF